MATSADRLPQPLDCTNLAKEWPRWKQKFNIYMIANNKTGETERSKIASFLWLVGEHGVEIYNSLFPNNGDVETMFGGVVAAADEDDDNDDPAQERTLADVINAFDSYCLPRKNLAVEAFKFNLIVQKEKQPFAEFETSLRTQLAYCEFECESCRASYAERMLRDRIILGIQDKKLQLKLLDGKNEPLVNIVEMCKVYEAAAENKQLLERKEVKNIIDKTVKESSEIAVLKSPMCYNCGQPFNGRHRRFCPAIDVVCDGCGRRGHFKKFCKAYKYKSSNQIGDIKGHNHTGGTSVGASKRAVVTNKTHVLNWADAE
ncbi:uncharacterized protein LOC134217509 [Armigeres subalbatus]|uniref:uncharacterized protein LOC134217509 n=1 Tax=Armigeres subalbatus TaxID=124917 RepID=UPI002ED5DA25